MLGESMSGMLAYLGWGGILESLPEKVEWIEIGQIEVGQNGVPRSLRAEGKHSTFEEWTDGIKIWGLEN